MVLTALPVVGAHVQPALVAQEAPIQVQVEEKQARIPQLQTAAKIGENPEIRQLFSVVEEDIKPVPIAALTHIFEQMGWSAQFTGA